MRAQATRSDQKKWFPRWVFPALLLFAIGTVWLRLAIVRSSYSIHQANQNIRNLKLQKEQMELRVSALKSPRKLEGLARGAGLDPPRIEQVIRLHQSKPLVEPGR